jgi:hypothetical protein
MVLTVAPPSAKNFVSMYPQICWTTIAKSIVLNMSVYFCKGECTCEFMSLNCH